MVHSKQYVVDVSSTKAEYIAVSNGGKDRLNIYHFLKELMQVITTISTHMVNQGAMYTASNLVTNK